MPWTANVGNMGNGGSIGRSATPPRTPKQANGANHDRHHPTATHGITLPGSNRRILRRRESNSRWTRCESGGNSHSNFGANLPRANAA